MKSVSRFTALVLVIAFSCGAYAQGNAPDVLVKSTVDEVLSVIKQSKDSNTLRQLAEQKVLPRFDFRQMTQLAVGKAWRKADPQQRKALEDRFRSLLVNTYTSSLRLATGRDRTVEVKPVQKAAKNEVTVKTLVKEAGRPPIAIDYRMESQPSGWKVFDVVVEGVSLVTTYRGSFAEEVRRSGIDGLIRVLDEKNRSLAQS